MFWLILGLVAKGVIVLLALALLSAAYKHYAAVKLVEAYKG